MSPLFGLASFHVFCLPVFAQTRDSACLHLFLLPESIDRRPARTIATKPMYPSVQRQYISAYARGYHVTIISLSKAEDNAFIDASAAKALLRK